MSSSEITSFAFMKRRVKWGKSPVPSASLQSRERKQASAVQSFALFAVGFGDLIILEAVDGIDPSTGTGLFKGVCGTPFVACRDLNEAVMSRIVVRVVQSGKVGLVMSQKCLAVVVPDFSALGLVNSICVSGDVTMEVLKEFLQ